MKKISNYFLITSNHLWTGCEYGITSDGFFDLEDLPKWVYESKFCD